MTLYKGPKPRLLRFFWNFRDKRTPPVLCPLFFLFLVCEKLCNRVELGIRPACTEGLPTVMLVIAWISTMPMLVGKVIWFQPILGVIVVSHGHSGQGPLLVWQGELEFDHVGVKIHLGKFQVFVCLQPSTYSQWDDLPVRTKLYWYVVYYTR